MSGSGRRAAVTRGVALAGVAAVLAVVLAQGATAGSTGAADGSPGGFTGGDPQAVVGEWTPRGVAPAAVRARTGADGEALAVVDLLRSRVVAVAVVAAGLAAAAAAWRALARPDARMYRAVQRAALAPRRAPPLALV